MDIQKIQEFVNSPVMQQAFSVLDEGTRLQFLIDGRSFEIRKVGNRIEIGEGAVQEPFIIFKASFKALDILKSAKDSRDFGRRFKELFNNQKTVDVVLMAPPGFALSSGVLVMLNKMGLKQQTL